MENKKGNVVVITLIIIVVAITAGILGWLLAKKTQISATQFTNVKPIVAQQYTVVPAAPSAMTPPVAPAVNNPSFVINGKTAKGFGMEVYFEDGILGSADKTINFSPKNRIIPPNGQPQIGVPEDIYQLTAMDYRAADVIIKEANESPTNTKKAIQKNINGLIVIESADGGFCDNRFAEVVGKKYNYQFSSLGCAHDEKTDFESFEKAIATIKFSN